MDTNFEAYRKCMRRTKTENIAIIDEFESSFIVKLNMESYVGR